MVHTDVMMSKPLYPRAALGSSQTDYETGQEEQGEKNTVQALLLSVIHCLQILISN